MGKKTLVIGASAHSYRYSYLAIMKLLAHGHEVFALGGHKGVVGSVNIETEPGEWAPIDTVTLYLNPYNQQAYYRYILELKPGRVIFNPGTENHELQLLLAQKGIAFMEACTLVMLSTRTY